MVGGAPGPGNGFIFRTRTRQDAKLLQAEHELNSKFRSPAMSRRKRWAGVVVFGALIAIGIVGKLLGW